ncbi:hypothetical protein V1J52_14320 [Streptomyces sp. TRM 70351]|uniref:hypothetical protein n=1 Tax=Streptomyces sp. TRM 70351 TaxID=3116552 RepID=UPI002E7B0E83|nr:hypothetical protein [Streptomyces sp. TRM 70351]MEE1929341.1 hypothetical protein [Streptomyces sp. TRM 70351]
MTTAKRPSARSALSAVLVLPLLLTACGGQEPAVDAEELAERTRWMGSDPELVYVTEAAGYEMAQQSVGVYGGDGFSAMYVSQDTGAMFQLSVESGDLAALGCAEPAIPSGSGKITCEQEGELLYRSAGGGHEYARAGEGHVVRVSGARPGTGQDTLRAAAGAARPADDAELDALLPEVPGGGAPVERGDLPPHGDGAPDNSPGLGG